MFLPGMLPSLFPVGGALQTKLSCQLSGGPASTTADTLSLHQDKKELGELQIGSGKQHVERRRARHSSQWSPQQPQPEQKQHHQDYPSPDYWRLPLGRDPGQRLKACPSLSDSLALPQHSLRPDPYNLPPLGSTQLHLANRNSRSRGLPPPLRDNHREFDAVPEMGTFGLNCDACDGGGDVETPSDHSDVTKSEVPVALGLPAGAGRRRASTRCSAKWPSHEIEDEDNDLPCKRGEVREEEEQQQQEKEEGMGEDVVRRGKSCPHSRRPKAVPRISRPVFARRQPGTLLGKRQRSPEEVLQREAPELQQWMRQERQLWQKLSDKEQQQQLEEQRDRKDQEFRISLLREHLLHRLMVESERFQQRHFELLKQMELLCFELQLEQQQQQAPNLLLSPTKPLPLVAAMAAQPPLWAKPLRPQPPSPAQKQRGKQQQFQTLSQQQPRQHIPYRSGDVASLQGPTRRPPSGPPRSALKYSPPPMARCPERCLAAGGAGARWDPSAHSLPKLPATDGPLADSVTYNSPHQKPPGARVPQQRHQQQLPYNSPKVPFTATDADAAANQYIRTRWPVGAVKVAVSARSPSSSSFDGGSIVEATNGSLKALHVHAPARRPSLPADLRNSPRVADLDDPDGDVLSAEVAERDVEEAELCADEDNDAASGQEGAAAGAAAAGREEGQERAPLADIGLNRVLVAKVLTISDARTRRLILPRGIVESNMPQVAWTGCPSYTFPVWDSAGLLWRFVIRSWHNGQNPRPVYVLEHMSEFIRMYGITTGDVVGLLLTPNGAIHVEVNTPAVIAAVSPTNGATFVAASNRTQRIRQIGGNAVLGGIKRSRRLQARHLSLLPIGPEKVCEEVEEVEPEGRRQREEEAEEGAKAATAVWSSPRVPLRNGRGIRQLLAEQRSLPPKGATSVELDLALEEQLEKYDDDDGSFWTGPRGAGPPDLRDGQDFQPGNPVGSNEPLSCKVGTHLGPILKRHKLI